MYRRTAAPLICLALAGCSSAAADSTPVVVTATETACEVGSNLAAGTVTFAISNDGARPTEFYLLASDGLRVIGEAANIGPGQERELVVTLQPGDYVAACKPGMTGAGIRTALNVAGTATAPDPALTEVTAAYAAYVRDQVDQFVAGTGAFAAAYVAGQDDQARARYAPTRMHWERIEPVAESFGDLDPRLDLREADLEPGQEWTGWHRIEKDLWPPAGYQPLTPSQRAALADTLVADTAELLARVGDLPLTVDQIGNGAKELLDEVATGKITGEEEAWSHTDLWDFQANVDGARVMFDLLRPLAADADPELVATLDARFGDLQSLLDAQRSGDGFVLYPALEPDEIKELAAAVDALAEPLAGLTAAVVS